MARKRNANDYTVVPASSDELILTDAGELGCHLSRLVIVRAAAGSDVEVTLADGTGSLAATVYTATGSGADYATQLSETVEIGAINVATSDATDTLDDTAIGWYITTGPDVTVTAVGQKG